MARKKNPVKLLKYRLKDAEEAASHYKKACEEHLQEFKDFKKVLSDTLASKERYGCSVDGQTIINEVSKLVGGKESAREQVHTLERENARLWHMVRSLTHDPVIEAVARAIPGQIVEAEKKGYMRCEGSGGSPFDNFPR